MKVRQKISIYTNVPVRRVFSMHDLSSIYLLPDVMREAGLDSEVVQLLRLGGKVNSARDARAAVEWARFTSRIGSSTRTVRIGITGKYTALRDSYASILKALEHAGAANDCNVEIDWIDTTDVTDENVAQTLAACDGIIVPGGFGVRGTAGKIACVKYARQHKLPYLGICLGFQMAVIEFARNVCNLPAADSTEINPDCKDPVISILPEQKKIEGLGGNMRLGGQDVELTPGTLVAELFKGAKLIRQRFRHRFEVDPRYVETLEKAGLIFSGKHPVHPIMQVLELPRDVHPYFLAGQFHPEMTSRPLRPQPMFVGLVAAAMNRTAAKAATVAASGAGDKSPAADQPAKVS
jgi:CTP synthase